MAESTDLGASSILKGLNIDYGDSMGTKYVNKIENLSLSGNNLNITVTTKRSFGDYVWGYIFFIMRCAVIFLIPLYLFLASGINFSDLLSGVKDNVTSDTTTSFNLGTMHSRLNKTDVLDEYVGLMDELLEN